MKTDNSALVVRPSRAFGDELDLVLGALRKFMIAKNSAYGNSALNPVRVWSDEASSTGIRHRLDDKLSRIRNRVRNGEEPLRNDVVDHIGYELLYCIAHEWFDFTDLID